MFMRSYEVHLISISAGGLVCLCVWTQVSFFSPLAWIYRHIACSCAVLLALRVLLQRSNVFDWAPTVVSYSIIGAYVIFATIAVCWTHLTPVDLSETYGGHPERIWDTCVVVWYAVVPFLSMGIGILFSTLSIPLWHTALLASYAQIACAAASWNFFSPALDERHPFELLLVCQVAQQMAFMLGFGVGIKLVQGQKVYFDHSKLIAYEAGRLRSQLREKELGKHIAQLSQDKERLANEKERLTCEKERLYYDRQMVILELRRQREFGVGPVSEEESSESGGGGAQEGSEGGRGGVQGRPALRSRCSSRDSSPSGRRWVTFSDPPASVSSAREEGEEAEEAEVISNTGVVRGTMEGSGMPSLREYVSMSALRKLSADQCEALAAQIEAEERQVRLERTALNKILAK